MNKNKINNTPLISIITVVYNGEKTLEQTIQSVINQTYDNIEYIIIDGGSTDGTISIIKKYSKHINYWVSEADAGLYDAMNKGISLASGELIGMINSDDWYNLDTVSTIVSCLKFNSGKRIFHGDLLIHDKNGKQNLRRFNPSLFKMLNYGVTYNHPTFFVSKEIYKQYSFNINLVSVSDVQFILEILLKEKDVFVYINKVLANFRKGGISSQQTIVSTLKANYTVRKNAGYTPFNNFKALIINICYQVITKSLLYIKKTMKYEG